MGDKFAGAPVQLWKLVCVASLLAMLVALQYVPSLHFGFLDWDDTSYLEEDGIARGLDAGSLKHAFTTFHNPYFMPWVRLSYMLDVTLFGTAEATGFRVMNILIHALNCVLLFWLVYRVSGRWWAAAMVGLLFGIHPQHVEAVVWVAGRKELLAGLFGLLSLNLYQSYVERREKAWLLGSVLAYGSSLMCKPIWITLPLLLLLWDYFPLRRLQPATFRACAGEKLPFLLLGLAYSLLFTYSLQVPETPVSHFPEVHAHDFWALPVLALGRYLANTFLPVNLVPYYAFPDIIPVGQGLLVAALLLVLTAVFWRLRHRYPALLMGALWFGLALVPPLKITLLPQGEAIYVGDRYSYLAHIGLFVALVMTADAVLARQSQRVRQLVQVLAVALLALLFYLARLTTAAWEYPEKLWLLTHEHNEGRGRAYPLGVLAAWYEKQQRYGEAILLYRKAHETDPAPFIYPMMVGSLLGSRFGQHRESEAWFDKMLVESPAPAQVLLDYGRHQLNLKHFARAERFLARAATVSREGLVISGQYQPPANLKQVMVLLAMAQTGTGARTDAYQSLEQAGLSAEEKAAACRQWFPRPDAGVEDRNNPLYRFCREE